MTPNEPSDAERASAYRPLPQIIRLVVSDRFGHFSVRLSAGDYQVMPLIQAHTSGEPKLTVHMRTRHTTKILVRFLGVPYDWRRPSKARVKQRWWNPDEPRLFTPKSFGWGWSINLARLLGQKHKPPQ